MHSIIPLFFCLATVASLSATETEPPATAPTPTKISAEAPAPGVKTIGKAPADFPLTLRGFFGKGDKAEISVQDKSSGKSVWLKPGETNAGWKLETADASTGRAVFSQGARRVRVFQAGESREPARPRLKSIKDSSVMQKLAELGKNEACRKLIDSMRSEALGAVLKNHPEWDDSQGMPNYIVAAMCAEEKRLLLAQAGPEAEALKPILIPIYDSQIAAKTRDPNGVEKEEESMTKVEREQAEQAELLVYEHADELYRQRTGGK